MERIEDLTYKAQQRQRQGRTSDAIRLFEQALEFRIDLHGAESSSVRKACDNLSDVLNGAALKHLQVEEYEEAKKLLQKAEMLTGPDDLISAVTYNNIACYYRRKNKLRTALKYLQKAQRIEMRSCVVANPAGTRLNLCAVLSQLERHHEALEHAQAAVVLLQEELSQMEMNGEYHENRSPETLNKMAVLAISYHNIGVEEEYLRRHAASLAAYKKGVQIAREYLGPDNDITRTLIKSCKAAQEHLDMSHMKKSLANSGGIRQGEKMGAAYHALQQHNDTKRRAQSAGAQRSQSATPSWAMDGERSLSRPSTSYQAATSKSLSRARAWVDDERNGDSSIVSAVFERGKGDMRDRSREEQRHQDGYSEDGGHVPGAARTRQRPASALGALDYRSGKGHSCRAATGVVQSEGRMDAKRGPVTPRLEEGDQKGSAIRRPASASLREPVRANLKASEERESLEKKLRRVDEEEEHKQSKSYAWEEGNESGSDDDEQELIDDDPQDSRNSNRRIAYGQPDRELGRSGTRPRDVSPQRAADRLRADNAHNGRSDSSGTSYSSSGISFQNGGGLQLPSLDDDMLDNLELEEGGEDDVDSGTEALMQIRQQGAKSVVRPASATLARPSDSRQRGAPASRPSQRPASASFAVIHERRARDQAKRPSSAAPVHAVPQNKYAVARAASDSSHPSAAGQMLDCPVIASDRAKLRPASASFTRPASASFTRHGSARPRTASTVRPASANIVRPTSQDLPQDEMARSSQREEREILDILSDHSDYESDLELEAETRALNKHSNLHRPQNNRASVRSRDQGLEVKRAQLLAKTELGLDHSLYESDDEHQDRQLVQGTLIGDRPKRPSDSGRTQRPSDKTRADKARAPAQPLRPSDRSIRQPSRPSSVALPGRLHEEVVSPSCSEYESDHHANAQEGKPLLDDMSGTLKWLEDGLTTRQD